MKLFARPNPATPKRTVLVVDDDGRVRAMLLAWFEAQDLDVAAAADGEEALALLRRREYYVVICDLLMPKMTGDELFRICREERLEVASRFIFLTGGCRGLPPVDFAVNSGQPFLSKPFRLTELQAAIDQITCPLVVT